jgi:Glycosyl hydrolase family 12
MPTLISRALPAAACITAALAVAAWGSPLPGSQRTALDGGRYELQVNEFNSAAPLRLTHGAGLAFTVVGSGIANTAGQGPGAFPSIYRGCHWGLCTPDSGLPVRVWSLDARPAAITLSAATRVPPGGRMVWSDAFDLFLTPCDDHDVSHSGCSQADRAASRELMIWLDRSGGVAPRGTPARAVIAGISFSVWMSAHTIWYIATSPHLTVTRLPLGLFTADALRRGAIPSASWHLMDAELGFEIWSGGTGLAVTSMSICTPAGC